jgi:LysR family carnitine catabolism transcriptional activator
MPGEPYSNPPDRPCVTPPTAELRWLRSSGSRPGISISSASRRSRCIPRLSKITVRMVEPEDADAVADRVRDGSSEVGLAELPITAAGIETHALETQEYVALIPTDLHPSLTRSGQITIRSLAAQPLITSPQGTSTRRQIDEAFTAAGLHATVAVETDHREAIGPLVTAGAGIAVLPRQLARDVATTGVVIADITPPITRDVGLIHRSGPLSPAARAFLTVALNTESESRRPNARHRGR